MPLVLEKLRQYWWCLTDDNGLDIPLSDVNQVNVFGESPIHIAAWKGDAEDIQWLLNNGADANQRGEFGMTPLHYAYMGGNRENVDILLKGGADPNLRCDYGLLPHEGRPGKPQGME
jgi:ankyrin repeat protein